MKVLFPWHGSRAAALIAALPLIIFSTGCSLLPSHGSSQATENAEAQCADATLFALHAVREHQLGATYAAVNHDIDATDVTYKQLYPTLSIQHMHTLLHGITANHRSRFEAGKAAAAACKLSNSSKLAAYTAPYLSTGHSDIWCAQALDYGIGMAGYREMGFPGTTVMRSVFIDPFTLQATFVPLKKKAMADLVQSVYTQKWSRGEAAVAIAAACVVDPSMNDPSQIHAAVTPETNP